MRGLKNLVIVVLIILALLPNSTFAGACLTLSEDQIEKGRQRYDIPHDLNLPSEVINSFIINAHLKELSVLIDALKTHTNEKEVILLGQKIEDTATFLGIDTSFDRKEDLLTDPYFFALESPVEILESLHKDIFELNSLKFGSLREDAIDKGREEGIESTNELKLLRLRNAKTFRLGGQQILLDENNNIILDLDKTLAAEQLDTESFASIGFEVKGKPYLLTDAGLFDWKFRKMDSSQYTIVSDEGGINIIIGNSVFTIAVNDDDSLLSFPSPNKDAYMKKHREKLAKKLVDGTDISMTLSSGNVIHITADRWYEFVEKHIQGVRDSLPQSNNPDVPNSILPDEFLSLNSRYRLANALLDALEKTQTETRKMDLVIDGYKVSVNFVMEGLLSDGTVRGYYVNGLKVFHEGNYIDVSIGSTDYSIRNGRYIYNKKTNTIRDFIGDEQSIVLNIEGRELRVPVEYVNDLDVTALSIGLNSEDADLVRTTIEEVKKYVQQFMEEGFIASEDEALGYMKTNLPLAEIKQALEKHLGKKIDCRWGASTACVTRSLPSSLKIDQKVSPSKLSLAKAAAELKNLEPVDTTSSIVVSLLAEKYLGKKGSILREDINQVVFETNNPNQVLRIYKSKDHRNQLADQLMGNTEADVAALINNDKLVPRIENLKGMPADLVERVIPLTEVLKNLQKEGRHDLAEKLRQAYESNPLLSSRVVESQFVYSEEGSVSGKNAGLVEREGKYYVVPFDLDKMEDYLVNGKDKFKRLVESAEPIAVEKNDIDNIISKKKVVEKDSLEVILDVQPVVERYIRENPRGDDSTLLSKINQDAEIRSDLEKIADDLQKHGGRDLRTNTLSQLRSMYGFGKSKYEGFIPEDVLKENRREYRKMRQILMENKPDAIVAIERGGVFVSQTLITGTDLEGKMTIVPKSGDESNDFQSLRESIQQQINLGAKKIAISDSYMGGSFARSLTDNVLKPILRANPEVNFEVYWMRETFGFEQVSASGLTTVLPFKDKLPDRSSYIKEGRIKRHIANLPVVLGDDLDMIFDGSKKPFFIFNSEGEVVEMVKPESSSRETLIDLIAGRKALIEDIINEAIESELFC